MCRESEFLKTFTLLYFYGRFWLREYIGRASGIMFLSALVELRFIGIDGPEWSTIWAVLIPLIASVPLYVRLAYLMPVVCADVDYQAFHTR